MRFFYLNALLSAIILTSGCASSGNKTACPLLSKVWNSSRQAIGILKPNGPDDWRQCGCHHCKTMKKKSAIPVQQSVAQDCGCGSNVSIEDCGCNQWSQVDGQGPNSAYGEPVYMDSGNAALAEPQQEIYQPFDLPADTLTAPVAASELPATSAATELDNMPSLLTEPPPSIDPPKSEPTPYAEPKFQLAPPEIDGVAVPEIDAEAGFLSPQSLSDSEEKQESAQEDVSPEEDPNDFDSVLGPTEAESLGQNILQSDEEAKLVVLKARPVLNHRINNQGVLRPGEAMATNRTDSYGLPVDKRVQFAELPPLDNGTRPRPVSFHPNPKPMPPVKHLKDLEVKDKTTKSDTGNLHVVESTTSQPADTEPMLRMTAIPYAGASSLGAAIARIKVGKTPLIVRGEYPRDHEYERLARERNEQSMRSVIIPSTSLKTIDR